MNIDSPRVLLSVEAVLICILWRERSPLLSREIIKPQCLVVSGGGLTDEYIAGQEMLHMGFAFWTWCEKANSDESTAEGSPVHATR